LNAMFAADHFGLGDGCRGTAVGKSSMQTREFDPRPARVPVNHGGILEVLAKDKVRCEEVFLQLREGTRLMATSPLGSNGQAPKLPARRAW
jgi:hypothetical protein